MPLRIEQDGAPTVALTARYATDPLGPAPYYAARLARGSPDGAWEVELIHHKLYLENTTPEVAHLEATHGYNYLLVNRSVPHGSFQWRLGVGIVMLHLEGTVRGHPVQVRNGIFNTGYRLTGPAAQVGVGRPIHAWRRLFLLPELKFTAAYASVPIEGGGVKIPNVAVHALLGVGYALAGAP